MDRSASLSELDVIAEELMRRGETALAEKTRHAVAALRADIRESDLVRASDAAELLGVRSIALVKRWVCEGFLDGALIDGHLNVSRESIERVLDSPVLARERAWEREVAETLEAFDAGDLTLPPSDVSHLGRAPWDRLEPRST